MVKNPPVHAGDRRYCCDPWVGKIPWSRKWQAAPVFLPEKSHGQKCLMGYSPEGHKESDTTEWLSTQLVLWASLRHTCLGIWVALERGVNRTAVACLHSGGDRNETSAVPCTVIHRMTWKHAAHTFRRENDLQLMESGNSGDRSQRLPRMSLDFVLRAIEVTQPVSHRAVV